MAQYANQHFVPQYYFRRFTRGSNAINLILLDSGRVILNASIRHQCAGHRFYGAEQLERIFTDMEGTHANALRIFADTAWKVECPPITHEIYDGLLEAVLFQRSRTSLEIEKSKDVPNAIAMPAFRHYIANEPGIGERERMLEAIDKGEVRVENSKQAATLQAIEIALEAVPLVSDLDLCILRNHTDYPFLFGDSPVVFYNTLMRNVTSRGVLGLQSPGLQIFFPLGPETTLMLYDEKAYKLRPKDCIDLTERSDISQLNALQFKHSFNAVYFGCERSLEYVTDLWRAYRRDCGPPAIETRVLSKAKVEGTDGPLALTHIFEPHLDIRLGLSFINCNPVPDSGKFAGHRTPELVKAHKAARGRG